MQEKKLQKIDYITSDICSVMQLFFSSEEFDRETNILLIEDLLLQRVKDIESGEDEEYKIASKNKYLDYLLCEMINNASGYLKNTSYNYHQKCLEKKQNFNIQTNDGTLLTYYYFESKKKLFEFPIKKTQLLQIINDANEEVNNNFQNKNKQILSDYITKKLLEQVNLYIQELFDVDIMAKLIFDTYSRYYSMTVLPDEEKTPIYTLLNSLFTKIIYRERFIKEQKYMAYSVIKDETFLKKMTEAEASIQYRTLKGYSEQYEDTLEKFCRCNEKTVIKQTKKKGETPLPILPFF